MIADDATGRLTRPCVSRADLLPDAAPGEADVAASCAGAASTAASAILAPTVGVFLRAVEGLSNKHE